GELHAIACRRVGDAQHQRERDRARLLPDEDDPGPAPDVRRRQARRARADEPHGWPGGFEGPHRAARVRRVRVHYGADHRRRWGRGRGLGQVVDERAVPDPYSAYLGTRPVAEAHRFDVSALERYLVEHIEDFKGPLTVEQFKGGQSNPTYRLSAGGKHYVLRRKPPGTLLPSAHAVDREYRVITALAGTDVPVAR